MENDKTLLRIKTLTELHGAPGFEEKVRDYMKQEITPFVDEVITTHMGSIFGVKKSKTKCKACDGSGSYGRNWLYDYEHHSKWHVTVY